MLRLLEADGVQVATQPGLPGYEALPLFYMKNGAVNNAGWRYVRRDITYGCMCYSLLVKAVEGRFMSGS